MTALTLHVMPGSSSCRRVLLTLKALGDAAPEVEIKHVDLQKGEHMTDEFLGLNPLHCVPTMKTPRGGAWESRALMRYLVAKAGGHELYPDNPEDQVEVDRLLDWDLGTGYKGIGGYVYPQVFRQEEPTEEALDKLRETLHFLDRHQLKDDRQYLAGDKLTLADLCIAANLTMLELVGFEIDDYPRLLAWKQRMTQLPYWAEVNAPFEAWKSAVRGEAAGASSGD